MFNVVELKGVQRLYVYVHDKILKLILFQMVIFICNFSLKLGFEIRWLFIAYKLILIKLKLNLVIMFLCQSCSAQSAIG